MSDITYEQAQDIVFARYPNATRNMLVKPGAPTLHRVLTNPVGNQSIGGAYSTEQEAWLEAARIVQEAKWGREIEVNTQVGIEVMTACLACGALVADDDRERHEAFHTKNQQISGPSDPEHFYKKSPDRLDAYLEEEYARLRVNIADSREQAIRERDQARQALLGVVLLARDKEICHFGDSTGHLVQFSTSHLDRLQMIAEGKVQA